MRVSSQQLLNVPQFGMRDASRQVLEASRQLTDGTRFDRASGGAVTLGIVSRIDQASSVTRIQQENIDDLESSFSLADVSLGTMSDSLFRVKELLVQSRNGALGANERTAIQGGIQLELEAVARELGRTDAQGRVLFTPTPIDDPGVEIRNELSLQRATVLSLKTGVGTPVQIAAVDAAPVIDLSGGPDPAARYMEMVDRWLNSVVAARSDVGRRWDLADRTRSVHLSLELSHAEARSAQIDTDMAQASTDLAKASAQLQAAQAIFARIETGGLFSLLR